MVTGEAPGIVQAAFGIVGPDVISVSFCQPVDRLLDDSVRNKRIRIMLLLSIQCHNIVNFVLTSVPRPLAFLLC